MFLPDALSSELSFFRQSAPIVNTRQHREESGLSLLSFAVHALPRADKRLSMAMAWTRRTLKQAFCRAKGGGPVIPRRGLGEVAPAVNFSNDGR